jgi:hypothetical protein
MGDQLFRQASHNGRYNILRRPEHKICPNVVLKMAKIYLIDVKLRSDFAPQELTFGSISEMPIRIR